MDATKSPRREVWAAAWREVFARIRRSYRASLIVAHIATGFVVAFALGAFAASPHSATDGIPVDRPRLRRATRWWLARLTKLLALQVEVIGEPPSTPALFVANHISWIDIPVIGSITDVHFLSKAEVARWPLIGALATAAGTLYIKRGGGQVREKTRQIRAHIDEGRSVVVFPEGTTTTGVDVRAFHSPLFMAATDGGHPVQPVAIRYVDSVGRPLRAAAFVDDDEFHVHLWALLLEDRIFVQVNFADRIDGAKMKNRDARDVAAEAQVAVRQVVVRGRVARPVSADPVTAPG